MFDKIKSIKWALLRKKVLERDRYTCQYCGSIADLAVDHIWPRSKGGKDEMNNLICACKSCNSSKNGKTMREWLESKNITVGTPSLIHLVTIQSDGTEASSVLSILRTKELKEIAPDLISGRKTFSMDGSGLGRAAFSELRDQMIADGLAAWNHPKYRKQGVGLTPQGWAVIYALAGIPMPTKAEQAPSEPEIESQPNEEQIEIEPTVINEVIDENTTDVLYDRSVEIARTEGKISASMLQRKMRIGYNRASRLIDELEESGIIGRAETAGKFRKVFPQLIDEAP